MMKQTLCLVLLVALLGSLVPFSAPVQAQPEPVNIVEGFVTYALGVNPVSGSVNAIATDSDEGFSVQVNWLPVNGYLQFQGNFFEGDTVTITVEKEVNGYLFTHTPLVVVVTDDNAFDFGTINIDHPDAWITVFGMAPPGPIFNGPLGEGPLSPTEWEHPVMLEHSPDIYTCYVQNDVIDNAAILFDVYMSYEGYVGPLEEGTFQIAKWMPDIGRYFILSTGSLPNDVLLATTSFGTGPTCFGIIAGTDLNTLPVAVINADKFTVEEDEEVSFDCLDSFDYSDSTGDTGSIVACEWDFGDGDTGSGTEVTHKYDKDGTFTVTLTVTDNDATQDTDQKDITVEEKEKEERVLLTFEQLFSEECLIWWIILAILLYFLYTRYIRQGE
jgi:hypothetical protein